MNKYVRTFFHRGLVFGGFGPIITSLVLFFISLSDTVVVLDASDILIAVVSTYILAFVQSGVSVFNQIEGWPIARSLFLHLSCLYAVYVVTYLVNSWIPFEPIVIVIFTCIFVASYFFIWLTVFLVVRSVSKKMTKQLS